MHAPLILEWTPGPHGFTERWLVPRHCVRFTGRTSPELIGGGWMDCDCVPE